MNWFEVEFILLKHLDLQPSELDRMEFYRAEYLLHFFKEYTEKEKAQHNKETANYSPNDIIKNQQSNKNSLQQMAKTSMPKMPKLGNNLPTKFPNF
jgi:hypothetical protein